MKRLTRAQAIKAKCVDCCCGDRKEVKLCENKHCPLWTYRLGKEVILDGLENQDSHNQFYGQNTPQN